MRPSFVTRVARAALLVALSAGPTAACHDFEPAARVPDPVSDLDSPEAWRVAKRVRVPLDSVPCGAVAGAVIARRTMRPDSGVIVRLVGDSAEQLAVTDARGRFLLHQPRGDTTTLELFRPGGERFRLSGARGRDERVGQTSLLIHLGDRNDDYRAIAVRGGFGMCDTDSFPPMVDTTRQRRPAPP